MFRSDTKIKIQSEKNMQNSFIKPIDILLIIQFTVVMFFTVNSCTKENKNYDFHIDNFAAMEYPNSNELLYYNLSDYNSPQIESISSDVVSPGELINIYGTGFETSNKNIEIYIGNTKTKIHSVSQNSITAIVPQDASSGKIFIKINEFAFISKNNLLIGK